MTLSALPVPEPKIFPEIAPPVMSIAMFPGPLLTSIAVPPVPEIVPELEIAPWNVSTCAPTTMPVAATMPPVLMMPPEKVEIAKVAPEWTMPPTNMPIPGAVIEPALVIPPPNVEILTDAVVWVATPPTQMPLPVPLTEIKPALLMPPKKVPIARVALSLALATALPPTKMPTPREV